MALQLIVYNQNTKQGFGSDINTEFELTTDGQIFVTVNDVPIETNTTAFGMLANWNNLDVPINTWRKFSSDATDPITASDNTVTFADAGSGIAQTISQLEIGQTYNVDLNTASGSFKTTIGYNIEGQVQLLNSDFLGFQTSEIGNNIFSFTAPTTEMFMFFEATTPATVLNSVSITGAPVVPSGAIGVLYGEKSICDLYTEESIPLVLSIDDFKNAAEQTQSYSKAFDLPGTKKNNVIFSYIFEITRSWQSINFNPYIKTKCELKEDGFLIFEGYLQLLNIKDKEGEISYSVNIYSEVITLADILKTRTFAQLNTVFEELEHPYDKNQIKYSWNDSGTGITWDNPSTSGFRDYATLKYPFVDWTHQYSTDILGQPMLSTLETAFRPWIQIYYLINVIFESLPQFKYTSTFFETDEFKKLYMDFNWGSGNGPLNISNTVGANWMNVGSPWYAGNGVWTPLLLNTPQQELLDIGYSSSPISGTFTSANDNTVYSINYTWYLELNSTADVNFRWLITRVSGLTEEIALENNVGVGMGYFTISGWYDFTLNQGDTLVPQFMSNDVFVLEEVVNLQSVSIQATVASTTSSSMLQNLRGELNQWDFLKGIMTMFNLVSVPDKDNPNNIIIETYDTIFNNSTNTGTTSDLSLAGRGIKHDWTEKIDVSQISLTPLDIAAKVVLKYENDTGDYIAQSYKSGTGGIEYGAYYQDFSSFYNILEGTNEIVASPFAPTISKMLDPSWAQLVTPAIYSYNSDDDTSEGFDNLPRICYNNGKVTMNSFTYYIPAQAGFASEDQPGYLQFSHLTDVPTIVSTPPASTDTNDFNFGESQYLLGLGDTSVNNLTNRFWLPYLMELYHPDTKTMTLKVNLTPSDIATFKFNETVFIKNRQFRVNKIEYQAGQLSTVEFVLINDWLKGRIGDG